jgi:hypothetical protein
MMTKRKSPEEITKANLKKSLDKLKVKVAEKEEVWLEVFTDILPLCIPESRELAEGDIVRASLLADVVLREYEGRWGS